VNGHAQRLALAVLLYYEKYQNVSPRQTFERWRQCTGSANFSATALVDLARRVLDESPPLDGEPRLRKRTTEQLHERYRQAR